MPEEKQVSKEFREVFMSIGGGSPVSECDCGRTCYAADSSYFDEGELERLEAQRLENPKAFIQFRWCDSVSFHTIFGSQRVDGCPCNYAIQLESLLWKNRHDILKYLAAVNKAVLEDALATEKLVESMGDRDA